MRTIRAAAALALASCAGAQEGEVRIEGPGLRAVRLARDETTWGEFNRFHEAPRPADGVTRPTNAKSYLQAEIPLERLAPGRPVTNVRWHAAMAYCQWLSVTTGRYSRLPTLAEWEQAAGRAGIRDLDGGAAEYALEWEDDGPVLLRAPGRKGPVRGYRSDPALPQSVWWVSGGHDQGFRVARPEGAATREELAAYAPHLEVRVLGHAPRTAGKGPFVQFFVRVSLEIRNAGGRAVDEVQVLVYALDPGGRPHWTDTGSTDRPGRATFTWAHPALRNGRAGPLAPGETRRFEADVPEPQDDEKSVDKGRFGTRITGLCLG